MRDIDPTASEFITTGFITASRPGGRLYDPASLLGAGASLFGGLMSSDSAGDAADAQAGAARASDATQRYQYDTTRADNAPFRETGLAANNKLAQIMGLRSGGGGGGQDQQALRNQLLAQFTSAGVPTEIRSPFVQGHSDDGNWGGEVIGYGPASQIVDEQGLQAAINQRMSQQTAEQDADPSTGSLMRNFSMADRDADPVYQSGLQFGLDNGNTAINRQAAAGGSTLSGATLKALTRFGNDYGSTKAGESYNRFNNNQDRTYNKLAGLSGAGQQATNQVSAAGQNMANNISASQQGLGNAQGASSIARGNAWQNGLNGAVSAFRGSQGSNQLAGLFDNGYSSGTGSAYGGSINGDQFTPFRRGM